MFGKNKAQKAQASAWLGIWDQLNTIKPGFANSGGSAFDCSTNLIQELARKARLWDIYGKNIVSLPDVEISPSVATKELTKEEKQEILDQKVRNIFDDIKNNFNSWDEKTSYDYSSWSTHYEKGGVRITSLIGYIDCLYLTIITIGSESEDRVVSISHMLPEWEKVKKHISDQYECKKLKSFIDAVYKE